MTVEEQLFIKIGAAIKDAVKGQLFGKPCFKIGKKAFVCFYKNEMVFKLTDKIHSKALNLKGAQLFDPSGKKRPMKQWVQVPFISEDLWLTFAKEAAKYCKTQK